MIRHNILSGFSLFVIGLFLGAVLTQLTINSQVIYNTDDLVQVPTCVYKTETGLNILPTKDICCETIANFNTCKSNDDLIAFEKDKIIAKRVCYNVNGELKVFFNTALEEYCKNNGYL